MSDLSAKVLIVTGASHGIGAAAARLFSRSGASVVLAARDEQALEAAGELSLEQLQRLRAGVVEALRAGIDARGASIDDFRHIDGVRGSFQDRFLVHRRAGEPCPRCGTPIEKIVAAGRGTYLCPSCQPPPGAARRARRSRERRRALRP